jgi:Tfp pilus assembly protein PilF
MNSSKILPPSQPKKKLLLIRFGRRFVQLSSKTAAITLGVLAVALPLGLLAQKMDAFKSPTQEQITLLNQETALINDNPKDYVALTNRALLFADIGDEEQARADFNRALSIHPSYARALIGQVALTRQHYPSARHLAKLPSAQQAAMKQDCELALSIALSQNDSESYFAARQCLLDLKHSRYAQIMRPSF